VAAWWRRPAEPAAPEGAGPDARLLWEDEWRCALRGLRHVLPGRWVNDPVRDESARLKVVQLEAARALGLDVPRTLVTNDLAEARRFLAGCRGGAVLKSLASTVQGGKTRGVTARSDWLPARLAGGPAILQERIPGLDLRVTVVGRQVFSVAADAEAAGCPDDVRIDWWRAAALARPVAPSAALARRLLALVRRLGLAYGAIDLRRRRDGRWAFLEVNPSGQWLHAEVATGQPITRAVVDLLAGGARGGAVRRPARRPASRRGSGSPATPGRAGNPTARRRP
jgi:glutathione synthase/RimK-type ligase-like ATP-grasp enzyme